MKLLRKTIGYQLLLTSLFFVLAGFALFKMIDSIENEEVDENLSAMKTEIIHRLELDTDIPSLPPLLLISPLDHPIRRETERFSTIDITDPVEHDTEPYRQLTVRKNIHGQAYEIVLRSLLIENRDMALVISGSIGLVLILLLFALLVMNYFMSRRLWAPFYQTLDKLNHFKLTSSKSLQPTQTNIQEFQELESAMIAMTEKLRSDYSALKAFTENASHEIQTPLAVILSKLEMLLQSEGLVPEQLKLMQAAYRSARRLSQTNKSMVMLTRIENRQFNQVQQIDVSRLLTELLEQFEDFIDTKKLNIQQFINTRPIWQTDPDLAHILLSNLLSNAIKHNVEEGDIQIRMEKHRLEISNSGNAPSLPTQQLFERFRKGNDANGNTGLGLALVKEICGVIDIRVNYEYDNDRHRVTLSF